MTLGIAIAGFIATVAAAFGGAWYGGRLQRDSNMENLGRQVQIDSAARFLSAIGDFLLVLVGAPIDDLTSPAIIGLSVQQSALGIVGPDELAQIADQIEDQMYEALNQPLDARDEAMGAIGRLAEQFEQRAAILLRPVTGQKNGRKAPSGDRPGGGRLEGRSPWSVSRAAGI